jgi:hypothetical protein
VPNNTVINNYKSNIRSFFGNKGTSFLADTRALHRGLAITKKNKIYVRNLFLKSFIRPRQKIYS